MKEGENDTARTSESEWWDEQRRQARLWYALEHIYEWKNNLHVTNNFLLMCFLHD